LGSVWVWKGGFKEGLGNKEKPRRKGDKKGGGLDAAEKKRQKG